MVNLGWDLYLLQSGCYHFRIYGEPRVRDDRDMTPRICLSKASRPKQLQWLSSIAQWTLYHHNKKASKYGRQFCKTVQVWLWVMMKSYVLELSVKYWRRQHKRQSKTCLGSSSICGRHETNSMYNQAVIYSIRVSNHIGHISSASASITPTIWSNRVLESTVWFSQSTISLSETEFIEWSLWWR